MVAIGGLPKTKKNIITPPLFSLYRDGKFGRWFWMWGTPLVTQYWVPGTVPIFLAGFPEGLFRVVFKGFGGVRSRVSSILLVKMDILEQTLPKPAFWRGLFQSLLDSAGKNGILWNRPLQNWGVQIWSLLGPKLLNSWYCSWFRQSHYLFGIPIAQWKNLALAYLQTQSSLGVSGTGVTAGTFSPSAGPESPACGGGGASPAFESWAMAECRSKGKRK